MGRSSGALVAVVKLNIEDGRMVGEGSNLYNVACHGIITPSIDGRELIQSNSYTCSCESGLLFPTRNETSQHRPNAPFKPT